MRIFIASLTIAIIMTGCTGGIYQNISSYYDRSVNFNKYKTYAWLNDHQPHFATPYANEIIENNIKNYVDDEFSNRNCKSSFVTGSYYTIDGGYTAQ